MLRPGYAVEYDCVQPNELRPTLERTAAGLYLAGRSTAPPDTRKPRRRESSPGSTPRWPDGAPPFMLRRREAYIGVMIDDLVTSGCLSLIECSRHRRNTGCFSGTTTPT